MTLSVLLGFGLTGFEVHAFEYWDCFVDTPSEVSEDTQGATIQSAGLLRFYNSLGDIDWEQTINAVHRLQRQKDDMEMTRDTGSNNGEVHTYARAYVAKGQAYYGHLSGDTPIAWYDSRPGSASCTSGILVLESQETLEEGTTESPSGDGTDCTGVCNDSESPILIDLDRGDFRLTDVVGGVAFDLIPGGDIERVAWTAPGSADGFLALDRNGNGLIDDGAELFGNRTPQPASEAPNGFLALAVFDRPQQGGDGDGWITERDQVFDELRLWLDGDHDGHTAADELVPLALSGVETIELSYVESRRRDQHGNELRYSSRVRMNGATTKAVDVFLLIH